MGTVPLVSWQTGAIADRARWKGHDHMAEGETIRLDQFLKLMGLVRSGGEAKHLIQEGQVQVNGVVETHRSRQLVSGDAVTMGDITATVEMVEDEE
jgi:ribosome-associated protein